MQSKNKPRVLVAEDDDEVSGLMEMRFRYSGFDCSFTENGEQALCMIRSARADGHPYDLIVLDGAMPVLDGFSVLRAIRDDDGDQTTVIMFTAYSKEPMAVMTAKMYGASLLSKEDICVLAERIEKKLAGDDIAC